MNSVDFFMLIYYTSCILFAAASIAALALIVMFAYSIKNWRFEL
jgi:hypothetical protein